MKNNMQSLLLLMIAGVGFLTGSCSDQLDEVQPNANLSGITEQNATNSITKTETTFTARAMIAGCHGENIEFTGVIDNKVKQTYSAGGQTHYIRQFTVKGMTGKGFIGVDDAGNPIYTGTTYDVVGGAEMFSIKDPVYNENGSLNLPASIRESDIVIHRGTLVFVNREDGSRVVARHVITKVPGAGLKENKWVCGGN